MKGMKDTSEYYQPPPKGDYPATIISAVEKISGKGNTQIHVQAQLDGNSEVFDDYLITDGTAKGAGIAKVKFRGLGVTEVDSNEEVPDSVICQKLIGRKTIVRLGHERQQKKDDAGNYVDANYIDPQTGATIPLYRGRIEAFLSASIAPPLQPQSFGAPGPAYVPPASFAPQAPVPQQQPQMPQPQMQFMPPQQQQAQQQFAGYPAPGAPSAYPAPAPQFAAPQAPAAPPFAAPAAQAPVQFAPPLPPAGVPWATGPVAAPVAPPNGARPMNNVK
jgi:hypothetical protein